MMKQITAKLGNMRKAQEFIVYPASKLLDESTKITIQSDKRIAQFDTVTGEGKLSVQRPNGAYFHDLFFGTDVVVPQDVIAAALAAQPKSGDEIGPGVRIA